MRDEKRAEMREERGEKRQEMKGGRGERAAGMLFRVSLRRDTVEAQGKAVTWRRMVVAVQRKGTERSLLRRGSEKAVEGRGKGSEKTVECLGGNVTAVKPFDEPEGKVVESQWQAVKKAVEGQGKALSDECRQQQWQNSNNSSSSRASVAASAAAAAAAAAAATTTTTTTTTTRALSHECRCASAKAHSPPRVPSLKVAGPKR